MSMNITIHAVGEIKTPNGKSKVYDKHFNCMQTPTKITLSILEAADPLTAYKNWLVYNNYKNNLNDLKKFIKKSDDAGFKIEVSYI